MKKKINRMLVVIAFLAILFTTFLITIVYHGLYEKQVFEDLRNITGILKSKGISEGTDCVTVDGVRVTLLDEQGAVLYDSEADSNTMGNHSQRPEIVQALRKGEGQTVRRSETLATNTYYYALMLENGQVLRAGREASSVLSIFVSALPGLLLVLAVLIVMCMVIAHFQAIKLIAPIEQLAEELDETGKSPAYTEMEPYIDTIKRQHEEIIQNARMRQEFTANVTHELKTPLTSISGYAELIETGMASEEDVTRFAHGIRTSANRLLTLINDIIRLSELDSTEEKMEVESVNLYNLARTCVDMLTMNAEKHQVTISLEGSEAWVQGNKQMLEELLFNLCDNAIRYNNIGGTVLVYVNTTQERALLKVKDTGIGIPKEHQERIFERFYRVDKSRSKSTGGTGLGLAIVKHIISKHDAEMVLHSEPGQGTEYIITFKNR
ncbi:MAG: two-component sensor histidine kinase [Lachnospiraceae bacterium]|nr:two-component sensor histidine kinase [Lachnospiraceae bacterium]